jgi:digeranylgeranylglycerophospholipid reductase
MDDSFDLVVVGAGPAGCLTAMSAAQSGASVVVVEQRPLEHVGAKVSFDSVTPRIFGELDLAPPTDEELDEVGKLLKVFSPDKSMSVELDVPNYLVDRSLLGKRLLDYAVEAGAEVRVSRRVIAPIVESGFVRGVNCRKGDAAEEIRGKVTADCSGFFAAVRSQLPPGLLPRYRLAREDVVQAYREVRKSVPGKDQGLCPPDSYEGYYDFLGYRGGYLWVVREKGDLWNVGIGELDVEGSEPASAAVRSFCDAEQAISDEVVLKGYGNTPFIALAGGLPCSVANGFMAVGEAAWQVCPGTGYGVYAGMKAGHLAGKAAAEAVRADDLSVNGLWPYEVEWKRSYGATFAFLDALRKFAQSRTDEELDWLMKKGIFGDKELDCSWNSHSTTYTLGEKISRASKGLSRPSLLSKAGKALDIGVKLYNLYTIFPRYADGFAEWEAKRDSLYKKLHSKLGIELHDGGYEAGFKTWEKEASPR